MSNNLLTISSVPAEKLESNQLQIIARWKDSKEKTVSPNNRNRAVILPANIWSEDLEMSVRGNEDAGKLLKLHVLDSLAELAKNYLSTICEESGMQRTQVPMEHFTLSALLQWQQEQAAISGRLNSEEIKNWLSESATIRKVTQLHGAEIGKALGEQFVKLAGPNHGLTPEKAAKILGNLWQIEDTDSTTGLRVQMRITSISRKTLQTQNVLDSIL
jgi:hypothetical protein